MRHEFFKAKTAYIFSTIILTISMVKFFNVNVYGNDHKIAWNIFLILVILFSLNSIIDKKTSKLVIDDEGVWLYHGYLPWDKRRNGVAWKYIEKSVTYMGFVSWVTKSYDIRIYKNFNEDSFLIESIARGDEAVSLINKILTEKIDITS